MGVTNEANSDAIDPSEVIVVIPTLNEAAFIERTLRQLVEGDEICRQCPVHVADGGSEDGTREIVQRLAAEFPNIVLTDNPGRTQSAALNMFLDDRFSGARVLIRCDAHSEYPPDFVSALVRKLSDGSASSVVIPMDAMAGDGCFQRGLAWIADSKLGAGGSPHRGGAASGFVDHGHHAAFDFDTFRKLGGYDEAFIANEDAEYDRRLTNSGGRIWLEASIRIGYYPRATPRGLWRQYFRYGWGRAQTCLKHGVVPKLRQLVPVFHVALLALSLAVLPFSLLGLVWPVFYGLVCLAAGASSALRNGSLCGLAGGLGLAIMHTAWGLGFVLRVVRGRGERVSR